MNKRGQVTIFILVAMVIVVAILVMFFYVGPTFLFQEGTGLDFERCVEDAAEQSIVDLGAKAGFVTPRFTYAYDGEEFTYLCYTNQFLQTCTVQVPFLKNNFDEQMELLMREKIDACYANSIDELKSHGYSVTTGEVTYNIEIEPGATRIEIDAPTVVGSQSFARFNVKVESSIYEMIMIATSIVQFEAKYGDADTGSLMLLYPNYIITKMKRGDGTTLYVLEDKIWGNKFQFASRSLVWPPGYLI